MHTHTACTHTHTQGKVVWMPVIWALLLKSMERKMGSGLECVCPCATLALKGKLHALLRGPECLLRLGCCLQGSTGTIRRSFCQRWEKKREKANVFLLSSFYFRVLLTKSMPLQSVAKNQPKKRKMKLHALHVYSQRRRKPSP